METEIGAYPSREGCDICDGSYRPLQIPSSRLPGSAPFHRQPSFELEIELGSLGPDGWYEKNMRNGALIGLTAYYDTPDPGSTGHYAAYYRVHWMGDNPDWGKWEYDDGDDGAGNDRDQIDMVELTIAPC